MPTVVLTTSSAAYRRAELEQLPEVRVIPRYELGGTQDERLLSAGLRGAWAVIAGSERYTSEVLRATPGLRAIVRWGIGWDAIDLAGATAAGVAVLVTPGVNSDAVADLALALMLACVRRLPELDAAVREGSWRTREPAGDLAGASVGIVGLGAVGRAVAARVRGFGCRIVAFEPQPDRTFCAALDIELAELDELLPRVDLLTLHAPLTAATRGLLGARELALLPRHAVVVNTARGQLIDQAALVSALRDGTIAAAGLDVFEHEPLTGDEPLTALPNVILTGHVGSFTQLGIRRTGDAVVSHVRELLAGRLPPGCLNPQAWDHAPGR